MSLKKLIELARMDLSREDTRIKPVYSYVAQEDLDKTDRDLEKLLQKKKAKKESVEDRTIEENREGNSQWGQFS